MQNLIYYLSLYLLYIHYILPKKGCFEKISINSTKPIDIVGIVCYYEFTTKQNEMNLGFHPGDNPNQMKEGNLLWHSINQ